MREDLLRLPNVPVGRLHVSPTPAHGQVRLDDRETARVKHSMSKDGNGAQTPASKSDGESKLKFRRVLPCGIKQNDLQDVDQIVADFIDQCEPVERDSIMVFVDARTKAQYCECHLRAKKIKELGTVDVPIDPNEQPEYRANREMVEDHSAFEKMKEDAKGGRTFSNIVAEFTTAFDAVHPLKIIGGQHRFTAMAEALDVGVDELHGLKVYFDLTSDQRLDVQLISNTNIATSTDLIDRMHETLAGPQLRQWCQKTGLLLTDEDFADKRKRGEAITVRAARTFILNYSLGRAVDLKAFDKTDTTPIVCKTGEADSRWEDLRKSNSKIWEDKKLEEAGKEFARLVDAQRNAFQAKKGASVDFAEKALNVAVMAAWAFVAGMLHANDTRRKRHFDLANAKGRDPLNAAALAKGRHKTDPENYRGLGYRTDPKERGRFVELFHVQAEGGDGITTSNINLAIMKYHAKQAVLEVERAVAEKEKKKES
jgi:hypothetical protein